MEPMSDDETTHYELPLGRLLKEVEYIIRHNKRQIEAMEEMGLEETIIERHRVMQDELQICQHFAVQGGIEQARERIKAITAKYEDLILF